MDRRLFFLLNRAQHKMFNHVDQVCDERFAISVTQFGALMFIAKQPGAQAKDVAQALDLNKSAVTGLLKRMEKKQLLIRKGCELDARAMRLYSSELGLEKLEQVMPLLQQLNETLSEGFSEAEIDVVLRFLHRLLQRF